MENTNILATLRKNIEEKATAYVAAYNDRWNTQATDAELNGIKKAATDAVQAFNVQLEKETYKLWDEQGDPVKTALRLFNIPHAQGISFKVDKNTGLMSAILKEVEYPISLLNIESTLGVDRFTDAKWFEKCQALAYILAEHIAKRVNPHGLFSCTQVSEAAKQFTFKEKINILSVDGVTSALQEVFDSILFLPSKADATKNVIMASDSAWTVINRSMTGHGRAYGSISINISSMSRLVAECMHIVLTNGDFAAAIE